jgi:hypothetical protein
MVLVDFSYLFDVEEEFEEEPVFTEEDIAVSLVETSEQQRQAALVAEKDLLARLEEKLHTALVYYDNQKKSLKKSKLKNSSSGVHLREIRDKVRVLMNFKRDLKGLHDASKKKAQYSISNDEIKMLQDIESTVNTLGAFYLDQRYLLKHKRLKLSNILYNLKIAEKKLYMVDSFKNIIKNLRVTRYVNRVEKKSNRKK